MNITNDIELINYDEEFTEQIFDNLSEQQKLFVINQKNRMLEIQHNICCAKKNNSKVIVIKNEKINSINLSKENFKENINIDFCINESIKFALVCLSFYAFAISCTIMTNFKHNYYVHSNTIAYIYQQLKYLTNFVGIIHINMSKQK